MAFDLSQLHVLPFRPWRWTDETETVKQELNGVWILLSSRIVDRLAKAMTATQKDELRSWLFRVTEDEAAEWHAPVWAGQEDAVYLRIPAAIWNDPTTVPPAKVRNYFQQLWKE